MTLDRTFGFRAAAGKVRKVDLGADHAAPWSSRRRDLRNSSCCQGHRQRRGQTFTWTQMSAATLCLPENVPAVEPAGSVGPRGGKRSPQRRSACWEVTAKVNAPSCCCGCMLMVRNLSRVQLGRWDPTRGPGSVRSCSDGCLTDQ